MERYLKNTVAVLFATALTAMAVYGIVLMINPTSSGYTQTASGGVVATSYGTSGTSGTLTCPATGCTASSCHATSGGGRGFQSGTQGYSQNGGSYQGRGVTVYDD